MLMHRPPRKNRITVDLLGVPAPWLQKTRAFDKMPGTVCFCVAGMLEVDLLLMATRSASICTSSMKFLMQGDVDEASIERFISDFQDGNLEPMPK